MKDSSRKVLIVKTGHTETLVPDRDTGACSLGDVLRTTVLLHLFRQDHVTWLTDPAAVPLLDANPFIDRLLTLDDHGSSRIFGQRFDLIVNLERSTDLCRRLDGVDKTLHFGFGWEPEKGVVGAPDNYGEDLVLSNGRKNGERDRREWGEVLYSTLGARWKGQSYVLGTGGPTVADHDIGFNRFVGGKWPVKSWPLSHWEALENLLEGRYSISHQQHLDDLRGYLDWLGRCRFIITSDSLGLHLGIALGRKVLALMGPTPVYRLPVHPKLRVLTQNPQRECMPCCQSHCDEDETCMSGIHPQAVAAAIDRWEDEDPTAVTPKPKVRSETDLPPVEVPDRYNYIAAFLTLSCNMNCSYCITRYPDRTHHDALLISGEDWLKGLNRLTLPPDLPVTLQGGEPSTHPDFYRIIEGLREDIPIDILTNLQLDVEEFMQRVPPQRIRRKAKYASIRVSYHPETMDLQVLKTRILTLMKKDYSVGIWAVRHPAGRVAIERAREECVAEGIDFRFKDFLGYHQDALYGTYRYPDAVRLEKGSRVRCRTTELIIGPSGDVFRCHGDLYSERPPIGQILERRFSIEDRFRPCDFFGFCNPCDVKLKTDRFQESGHTSVEIRTADGESRES